MLVLALKLLYHTRNVKNNKEPELTPTNLIYEQLVNLYKKELRNTKTCGDSLISNYIPISLLHAISKELEASCLNVVQNTTSFSDLLFNKTGIVNKKNRIFQLTSCITDSFTVFPRK